jgi:hypothetical protein
MEPRVQDPRQLSLELGPEQHRVETEPDDPWGKRRRKRVRENARPEWPTTHAADL